MTASLVGTEVTSVAGTAGDGAAGTANDGTPGPGSGGVWPGGVQVSQLRRGDAGEPLFLVPGLEGDPTELHDLVSSFDGPQDVYALFPAPGTGADVTGGIEELARDVLATIREVQPTGPYRLGGYSFGALIALEMAQQLRAAGDEVQALFLIEAVYDERYWSRAVWARALARRTGGHLGRIARMNPVRAVGEFGRRGGRLIQRLMRRSNNDASSIGAGDDAGYVARRAVSALSRYQPSHYDGSMVLVAASTNTTFGCDTAALWAGKARLLVVERVEGDHLTVLKAPASAAAVAKTIDHQLAMCRQGWAGLTPQPGFERPMILTTMRWFTAARLAHALNEAGFAVSACRPRGHALELVDGLAHQHHLHRVWRARSLVTAIREARPDLILPDDERSLVLLRRVQQRMRRRDPQVAALADAAQRLNIAVPATTRVGSRAELESWVNDHGLPMVVKTDGSWGGRGVTIVSDLNKLDHAWQISSRPPGFARSVKRLIFNGEAYPILSWLRRARPVVNAQGFIGGRDAIVTVSCHEGETLQLVCLVVDQASEARGPSTVVRIINHPQMASAARALVRQFGLSGFCGFDFILTDSGDALLLEMNPRVTPTAYLLVEGDHARERTVALFPNELLRRAAAGERVGLDVANLDVPPRSPLLVRRGMDEVQSSRGVLRRTTRRLSKALRG